MSALGRWLTRHGLARYEELFSDNAIGIDVLEELREADLAGLGIPLGDRKRILRAIGELRPADRAGSPDLAGDRGEEKRQLTLLFADLVGSTRLSRLYDLEDYKALIDAYCDRAAEIVRRQRGVVAEVQGDGVVAYFGYPVASEDAGERAVTAGLEIVDAVGALRSPSGANLEARVGIATGDVLVSDVALARPGTMDRVALGNALNLAARLQAAGRPGQVIVSERTRSLLGRNFAIDGARDHQLPGFAEPQRAWSIAGVAPVELRYEAQRRGSAGALFGREEELRLLLARWNQVRAGDGQTVLIAGEAGIGKSRLAAQVREYAAAEPFHWLAFQCSPDQQASAFHPVAAQIAYAAGIAPADPPELRLDKIEAHIGDWGAAPEIAPVLARLLGVPHAHRYGALSETPEQLKARTLAALLDSVASRARQRPTLVLFEDLHWVDPSSEELLDLLVARLHDSPTLMLCTCRPEYRPVWTGQPRVTSISLSRLDRRDSRAVVRHLLSDAPHAVVDRIVAKGEGVPFFLEELASMARQAPRDGDETSGLPATLKDLLRAKLDRVPTGRELVPICAAIGRSFAAPLVAAVARQPVAATRAAMDALCVAQVLDRRGAGEAGIFAFRHALIEEAAYDAMLRSTAREVHRRIAETLYGVADAEPHILARHYARAGMAAEARDAWLAAGEQAVARAAVEEAIQHLTDALAENDRTAGADDRDRKEIAIRKVLNVALNTRAFGSVEVRDNFVRLHELIDRTGTGGTDAFLALHVRFGAHLMRGECEQALALCPEGHRISREMEDVTLRTLATHDEAMAQFMLGSFDAAIPLFQTALSLREASDASAILKYHAADVRLVDLSMKAWALALKGNRPAARTALALGMTAVEAEPHDFTRCNGLNLLAAGHQTLEDFGAVRRLTETAYALSRRRKFDYWEAWGAILHGWAVARSTDPRAGVAEIEIGINAYLQTGSRQIELYALTLLADALLAADEIERSQATIARVREREAHLGVLYQRGLTGRVEHALGQRAKNGA